MSFIQGLEADWPVLSRLLDEALELSPAARGAWLDALPPEHAARRATLERLLSGRVPDDAVSGSDPASSWPRLEGLAVPPMSDLGAPKPGDAVGPYRLVRELGEGGMGSVWLAERADGQLKRPVALKLPRLTWARGLAERMARERDILATLEHPHIARLYDAGVDDIGRPWLALEYVPGLPIDRHARERGLGLRARVELLLQVCDAVAHAHGRLVIHRDLKPSNILVGDDGKVKLLDFGIAKLADVPGSAVETSALTRWAGRPLTPDHASPEQLRGEPLTTASDVYSLGIVAYELLAGAPPYRLERGVDPALAVDRIDIVPASRLAAVADRAALRGDLDAVLLRALQRAPAERWPGPAAFAADLQRWLDGQPVLARPERRVDRLRRWVLGHRAESGIALALLLAAVGGAQAQVAVALALGAGAAVALWQARRSAAQARRAEGAQAFLAGIFEAASAQAPDGHAARKAPVESLLHTSAQRLLQDRTMPVELRLDLLLTLSRITRDLDMLEPADAMLDERIAVLQRLPQRAADLVRARIDRYWAKVRVRDMDAAEATARTALAEARTLRGQEGRRLEATLLSILARQLAEGSSFIRGRDVLEQAVALLQRIEPDGEDLIDAQVLQAQFRIRQGEVDPGLAQLADAVRRFESRPDASLVNRDFFRSQLTGALVFTERCRQALPLVQQQLERALRSAGPGTLAVVFVQRLLALSQAGVGEVDAALRTLDEMQAQAGASASPGVAAYAGEALRQRGWIAFEQGRFGQARRLLDEALLVLGRHDARGVLLQAARLASAQLDLALGRWAEVRQTCAAGLADHVASGTAESHGARRLRLIDAAARVLADGPAAAAAALADIEAERAAPPPPTLEQVSLHAQADLARARVLGWIGDRDAALQALGEAPVGSRPRIESRSLRVHQAEVELLRAGLRLAQDPVGARRAAGELLLALQADGLAQGAIGLAARRLVSGAEDDTATEARTLASWRLAPGFVLTEGAPRRG